MSTALLAKKARRAKRRRRIRAKIQGSAQRPRLSVYRSNRGLLAQLIDDQRGHTVAAVRWIEPDLRELKPMEQAARAGELLAQRAKEAGVDACLFDRGGYKYHGQLKAFAEGARGSGLRF